MKDLNSPVPLNLSKILVELGYNNICFNYYKIENKARRSMGQHPKYVLHHNRRGVHNYDNLKLYMLAPSYQEAWYWLRNKAFGEKGIEFLVYKSPYRYIGTYSINGSKPVVLVSDISESNVVLALIDYALRLFM